MNADWVSIPDSPPSLGQFLAFDLQPVPLIPIIGVALAAVYLLGAVRLWASGRPWPVWRTLTFLLGCLIIVIVTGLGVEGYGYVMLSVFMFQQLTLMMLVPPLLILGLPGTLLLCIHRTPKPRQPVAVASCRYRPAFLVLLLWSLSRRFS